MIIKYFLIILLLYTKKISFVSWNLLTLTNIIQLIP